MAENRNPLPTTDAVAFPIASTVKETGMCRNCREEVTRTMSATPWYHIATGDERCAD